MTPSSSKGTHHIKGFMTIALFSIALLVATYLDPALVLLLLGDLAIIYFFEANTHYIQNDEHFHCTLSCIPALTLMFHVNSVSVPSQTVCIFFLDRRVHYSS